MPKVVIVQEYIPHYRVPFFDLLRERGRESGIEIVVVSGSAGSALQLRNDAAAVRSYIPIRQREFRFAGRRVVVRRFGRALEGADLIILEQARRNLDAYRLLAGRRQRKRAIALWGHGRDYTRSTGAFDRLLGRWLTSRANWFFAYTQGGVDAVTGDGYPKARTTVVQNSIDTTSLRNSVAAVPIELIGTFSRANDLRGKTGLFLGALDESKRLYFLLQAAEMCHEMDIDFRLVIAGDGALRGQVEGWALRHSWLTYLGAIRDEEKAVALAAAQVITMPGRVGLIAVDSFASETPIVTTDWAWHAPEFEYLEDGRNAVVAADQPSAYARATINTLSDHGLLRSLTQGCADAGNLINIAAMTENFLEGIRRVLDVQNS